MVASTRAKGEKQPRKRKIVVSSDEDDVDEPAAKVVRPRQGKQTKKIKLSGSLDQGTDASMEVAVRLHTATLHSLVDVKPIRHDLLRWYGTAQEARAMPWRKVFSVDSTPEERAQRAYEVWVSEIMLQQTQVVTVIPYYNRWMERFPTIQDLAKADIDTVNNLWKGLGYYSRAARLLSGAQKAVSKYGGCLPQDVKKMEAEIPGIGRYSAGAICSIAYGLCVPVLDGNVHRLMSRVLALHAPPKAKKTLDLLWKAAEAMVDGSDRPGDVNQALIELGSTVCKPRDPVCESCPLNERCGAYKESKGAPPPTGDIEDLCDLCEPVPLGKSVTRYPMKAVKKKARVEIDEVNIIEWRHNGKRWFVLSRRPEGGLLAGLYEFPSYENVEGVDPEPQDPGPLLQRIFALPPPKYKEGTTVDDDGRLHIVKMQFVGEVVHIFSHIKKTYRILWMALEGGSCPPEFKVRVNQREIKKKDVAEGSTSVVGPPIKWVLENEVADANIGTGVLNVWKKTRAFWNSRKN